jgi:hypothetical protein
LNTLGTQIEPKNWEFTVTKDKYFTCDDVLEAYLHGKKAGLEDFKKLLLINLSDNINKTGNYTSDIIKHIRKEGFKPESTYLKIETWNFFKILITLPEKEYLSKKFLQIYNFISKFEEKVNGELYRLEISFVETTGLDESFVQSDGFILKHKSSKS